MIDALSALDNVKRGSRPKIDELGVCTPLVPLKGLLHEVSHLPGVVKRRKHHNEGGERSFLSFSFSLFSS